MHCSLLGLFVGVLHDENCNFVDGNVSDRSGVQTRLCSRRQKMQLAFNGRQTNLENAFEVVLITRFNNGIGVRLNITKTAFKIVCAE